MANNLLSRQIPAINTMQSQNQNIPDEPDYQHGDVKMNFFSNRKDVLGESLWATYQKTNTMTGGALERAIDDSYYNINIHSGDYGISFEKNAYIDDMKQDYKLTLSKRF